MNRLESEALSTTSEPKRSGYRLRCASGSNKRSQVGSGNWRRWPILSTWISHLFGSLLVRIRSVYRSSPHLMQVNWIGVVALSEMTLPLMEHIL